MTTIYLIRHCQSVANEKRVYNSTINDDEGLSKNGKKQSLLIAKFFLKKKIARIYTSPFLRTKQTADAIALATKARIEIIDEIGEMDCGEWNGKTENDIVKRYPEAWRGWHYDPQNNPIPGGESLLEVQARALSAFKSLIKKHADEEIVIVTHYCVFNVIMCTLISNLANFRSFDTQNGTVAEIKMENVPRLKIYSPLD